MPANIVYGQIPEQGAGAGLVFWSDTYQGLIRRVNQPGHGCSFPCTLVNTNGVYSEGFNNILALGGDTNNIDIAAMSGTYRLPGHGFSPPDQVLWATNAGPLTDTEPPQGQRVIVATAVDANHLFYRADNWPH
jgi:hypothetical protein